jgi:hypothetical protein
MAYEQCTYSQATAVDSLQTSSLDTPQLSLLSGMDMPAKSSENAPQTDGSQTCECGKGMCECLILPTTPDKWIASMQDFLAKTLALLESKPELVKALDQGYTERFYASLAWYDQNSCSWKTYQRSLVTDWEPYLETWPRWGSMRNGVAYEHQMLGHHITETDGGYLPTPSGTSNHGKNHVSGRLDEWGGSSNPWRGTEIGKVHCAAFEEWMLGLPFKWTELTEYETPKSHSKQPQPTTCSEVSE